MRPAVTSFDPCVNENYIKLKKLKWISGINLIKYVYHRYILNILQKQKIQSLELKKVVHC